MDPAAEPKAENLAALSMVSSLLLACVAQYASGRLGVHIQMKPTLNLLMIMAFVLPFTFVAVFSIAIADMVRKFGILPRWRPWLLLPFLLFQIMAFSADCRLFPGTAPWYAFAVAVAFPIPAGIGIAYLCEKTAKPPPQVGPEG